LAPLVTQAQQLGGTKRTDLLRQDLGAFEREVIQVLVEFSPGLVAPRHSHPGEELVYCTEGMLEYTLDGNRPGHSRPATSCSFRPEHSIR
jgi:quercetin dioxygenase-like cupin family protein